MGNFIQKKPVLDQFVEVLEERCTDLNNPSNIQLAKHSFLVLTTENDHKIKFEFTHDGLSLIDYEYQD